MTTRSLPGSGLQARLSRRRLLRIGGAGLLLAPLVAACSAGANSKRFAVTINPADAPQFSPGQLSVPVGATVVWKNNDTAPHTVTCDPALAQQQGICAQLPKGAQPWNSGVLYTGQSWSYTFRQPGQYVYGSLPDQPRQMLGTIVVA